MKTIMFLGTRLGIGGAEQIWAELLPRLDKKKFRVLLCCLYEPGILGEQLKKRGIHVYERLARGRSDFGVFFKLIPLLRREKVDILYLINQPFV